MTSKSKGAVPQPARTRTAIVTYPYHTLTTCIEVAKAVREIGNGKQEVSRSLLAQHLKLDEKSGDFAQKLASSKCYGLIEGRSGFALTEISRNIFFPTEDPERQKRIALLQAAGSPGAFRALLDKYDGGKPPDKELLGNVISQELRVPESWKVRIANFFIKAMESSGAIASDGFLRHKAELEKLESVHGHNNQGVAGKNGGKSIGGKGDQDEGDPPEDEKDQDGVIVWKYPCLGKTLRIETPENMTHEVWIKLQRYITVLEPEKK